MDRPARFVRQFALTQGRVNSNGEHLTIDTLVLATPLGNKAIAMVPNEQQAILKLAATPVSIAEVSAHLGLHLGIAQVIVSDLAAAEYLAVRTTNGSGAPDVPTLERLLDDLQAY